jgi:hypothetical protein
MTRAAVQSLSGPAESTEGLQIENEGVIRYATDCDPHVGSCMNMEVNWVRPLNKSEDCRVSMACETAKPGVRGSDSERMARHVNLVQGPAVNREVLAALLQLRSVSVSVIYGSTMPPCGCHNRGFSVNVYG